MGLAMPGMPGSVGLVGPRAHRPTGPSLSLTLTLFHHFGMNSARTRIHDFPIRKFCVGCWCGLSVGVGETGGVGPAYGLRVDANAPGHFRVRARTWVGDPRWAPNCI